jgi:hypothetical protein
LDISQINLFERVLIASGPQCLRQQDRPVLYLVCWKHAVHMRPLELLAVSPYIVVLYKRYRFSHPCEGERKHALCLPLLPDEGHCEQWAGTYAARADDPHLKGIPRSRGKTSSLYPQHERIWGLGNDFALPEPVGPLCSARGFRGFSGPEHLNASQICFSFELPRTRHSQSVYGVASS